jgi:hypothetical protein
MIKNSHPDPDQDFLPFPDPGVKKAPDPGTGFGTLAVGVFYILKVLVNFNSFFSTSWKYI